MLKPLTRMMITYFFLFLITVSLGGGHTCFERYQLCADRARLMKGFPPCSILDAYMTCVDDTTEDCAPSLKDTVQKYRILLQKACQPGSDFFQRVHETIRCLRMSNVNFEECELEGEFHHMADLCSSVRNVIHCVMIKTESVCGKKKANAFRELLSPIQGLLGDCENSEIMKGVELQPCFKELVKCNPPILTRTRYTCPDTVRILTCYVDVAEGSCDLIAQRRFLVRITRRVVKQIPEYCTPYSAIWQNLEYTKACYLVRYRDLEPCHENYREAMLPILEEEEDHLSNELVIALARASVEYRDCWVENLGSACGEEGAFVAKYVFEPLAAAADDTCMELTGEKCNGADGVKSTIFLLILSLMYILTKEDE